MDLRKLQVIDWDQATKLAGNQRQLAKELLSLLMKSLREDMVRIKKLLEEQNYTELLKQVHKLHGALCYCGLPRLKTLVACLETELKNNIMDNLPTLIDQLDAEVHLLLKQYSCHI